MGPNLAHILDNYWRRQWIVPKVGKYLGTLSGTGRGVNQGNPASPIIFNIVVYAVVRAVLEELCIPREAQHGMGWAAGEINIVFYADDGRIVGRDHEWVQDDLDVMTLMFRRMGLDTNFENPRRWCVPPGSSGGSGGSWPISVRQQGKGKTSGSGRRRG